jgi:PhnB protein
MSVTAQLSVRDGRAAVAYYAEAFDAHVIYQVGGSTAEPETVAELKLGSTTFWVSDESPEVGNFSPATLGGSTVKLLLTTDNPVQVHQKAVRLGGQDAGPVVQSHGWLIGRVVDPFGHTWEIGKPLIPWPPQS